MVGRVFNLPSSPPTVTASVFRLRKHQTPSTKHQPRLAAETPNPKPQTPEKLQAPITKNSAVEAHGGRTSCGYSERYRNRLPTRQRTNAPNIEKSNGG